MSQRFSTERDDIEYAANLENAKNESLPREVRTLAAGLVAWEAHLAEIRNTGDAERGSRSDALHSALSSFLVAIYESHPDQAVEITEMLAGQEHWMPRYKAAWHLDRAFFASPERSRSVISALLTDEHPQVRFEAHDSLRIYSDPHEIGDGRPSADDRGLIPIDYLRTLPIHHLTVDDAGRPHIDDGLGYRPKLAFEEWR